MDGIHDFGGKYGFGPVDADDPVVGFHDRFEARVFTILNALGAAGVVKNTDRFRHAIERIDPAAYLTHGYYGRWLGGLENLMVEDGLLATAQIDEQVRALGGPVAEGRAARPSEDADLVPPAAIPGSQRDIEAEPRFAVGDSVVTRGHAVAGHTRLPAYARDRVGVVTAHHGGWVFPDTHAHGRGECATHLYTVSFEGSQLWGAEAESGTTVMLDLFEPYLDAAA